MSYYDDRRQSTRERRRGDDDYYDDTVYTNTRDNQRSVKSTAVVKRRNDSPEYDEEIRRDFSPGGGGFYRETTIRKSGVRPAGRARSYEEDRRYDDDKSFASSRKNSHYAAAKGRGHDDRRGGRTRRDDYSDYSSRSRSRSRTPPKRERRKSMPEEALAALGLGGLLAKVTGKSGSRSRSTSRDRESRARRERGGSEHRKEQMQQALKAAVLAGAGAAFRARNEDGGWNGEKGKRVLTAALTAGGVDGFINRDKDPEKHKFRDTIGAAVAGLATDRLVNGRSQSRGPNGRRGSNDSRSPSRGRAGDLLAGGGVAVAAKKMFDSVRGRSQSRGRDRDRSSSYDSRDSRSPRRNGMRSRSRSVVASGLSKIGFSKQADKVDPAGARERSRSRGPSNRSRSRGRYADDDYDNDRRSPYDPPNYGRGQGSMYDNRDFRR